MGVLAKKKIYPTSTNEDDQQAHQRRSSRINTEQNQLNKNHHRNILKQESINDESQFNSAKRNRTFIIRKAFQTGLNQLSSTIKKPVNHNRLTKLDSNNVELIQNKFRKNFHPLQIAAYFVFLFMTGLLFIYFLPMISLKDDKLIYLIYAICIVITIVHLILHTLAISINPADDNVIAKQRNQPNRELPSFDRTQHKHVIDSNQFCYICEVKVCSNSKHCSRCNVCIADFDHHCNWLNQCIGGKNYKLFISSVISALIGSSIILGLSILFIVCWMNSNCIWLDNVYINGLDGEQTDNQTAIQDLNEFTIQPNTTILSFISDTTLDSFITTINSTLENDYGDNSTDSSFNSTSENDGNGFDENNSSYYLTIIHLCIIFMSLILSSITVILLLHLLCFHLFLNCIGLSTYEFIVQRREAIQRINQGDSEIDRPTCNERILRCLSCQSDFCSNFLPKSQTTSQSIIERNSTHSNLIKKRQLSSQMSNESRMSRNSRESGRYSSRTTSLYDFATEDGNNKTTNLVNSNESDSTQVYIGSPQKQHKRVLEENDLLNKTLNNRIHTSEQEMKDENYQDEQIEQIDNDKTNNYASSLDDKLDSLNNIAELNANELLINNRLEKLNLGKQRNSLQNNLHRDILKRGSLKDQQNDFAIDDHFKSDFNNTKTEYDKDQTGNQDDNGSINHQYLDNLDEYTTRPNDNNQSNYKEFSHDQKSRNEANNHIRFKNIDDDD